MSLQKLQVSHSAVFIMLLVPCGHESLLLLHYFGVVSSICKNEQL